MKPAMKQYWMKNMKKTLLSILPALLLVACGTNTDTPATNKPADNNTGDTVLSFVAADKTDWDMEVAIDVACCRRALSG